MTSCTVTMIVGGSEFQHPSIDDLPGIFHPSTRAPEVVGRPRIDLGALGGHLLRLIRDDPVRFDELAEPEHLNNLRWLHELAESETPEAIQVHVVGTTDDPGVPGSGSLAMAEVAAQWCTRHGMHADTVEVSGAELLRSGTARAVELLRPLLSELLQAPDHTHYLLLRGHAEQARRIQESIDREMPLYTTILRLMGPDGDAKFRAIPRTARAGSRRDFVAVTRRALEGELAHLAPRLLSNREAREHLGADLCGRILSAISQPDEVPAVRAELERLLRAPCPPTAPNRPTT